MLTVELALEQVLSAARPRPAVRVALEAAWGLVLSEDVASDVDSPPHDKALVDGYAVRSVETAAGECTLTVVEEVLAGSVPSVPLAFGQATRVMTGAPLPAAADAVVMWEQTEQAAGDPRQIVLRRPVQPEQNLLRRGAAFRRGNVVLPAGCILQAAQIGLLAEAGAAAPLVVPRPRVAVLTTGDELVPLEQRPGPGQIRNSNGPLLAALAQQSGGVPVDLGVARDDAAALRERIAEGLACAEVLVLSGGVSTGLADLVPAALAAQGVRQVFHQVRLKPGKPLWFGVHGEGDAARLVFGLPGNPVSSLVCWELFVRPALGVLAGRGPQGLHRVRVQLDARFAHRGPRPTYHPAQLRHEGDAAWAKPLTWQGSADQRTLAQASALLCFPPGDADYLPGTTLAALLLGSSQQAVP